MASAPPMPTATAPSAVVYRRRFWPVATFIIIALCAVIFLLETLAGGSESTRVLQEFGAAYAPPFHRGQYWRLVMPMFLHIGFWHIAVNMYALYILGPLLERVYGYGRYSLIYVLAGMGSSYLSMLRNTGLSAGASGAIFGVAGAMLVTGYLHPAVVPPRWKRIFGKGLLIVLAAEFIFDFTIKWIDHWGHLGGLLTGSVLALVIPPPASPQDGSSLEEKPSQMVAAVPVALVILAMAATYQHYRTNNAVSRLLVQGGRLAVTHENHGARMLFQQAAKEAPDDARPHEALGALDLSEGRKNDAIREYEQALRMDPESFDAPFGLAQAYQAAGRPGQAEATLQSAARLFANNAEGHYAFASLCYEHKLYSAAVAAYQQALRLKPNMPAALNDLAWLYATCDDPAYRHPRQALELAQRAVQTSDWKQPDFIDTLAEAYYANGGYRQAVQTETRALQLDPSNLEFQEHMARYQRAGAP